MGQKNFCLRWTFHITRPLVQRFYDSQLLQQWRNHIGANGAAAPPLIFEMTFAIRPDPLSILKGEGVGGGLIVSI